MVKEWMITSILETAYLPSALSFAECFLSGTRQRNCVPSASQKTLGKQWTLGKLTICRVLLEKHSAKRSMCRTRATASARPWHLLVLCRVHVIGTQQSLVCRVLFFTHSANMKLCQVSSRALSKLLKNHQCPSNFFRCSHTTRVTTCSDLVYLAISLLYLVN